MSCTRTCCECHKTCEFDGWNASFLVSLWSGFCPKCESRIIDKANIIANSLIRAAQQIECTGCKQLFFIHGLNEFHRCEDCEILNIDDEDELFK
jgi:hypothetical protein